MARTSRALLITAGLALSTSQRVEVDIGKVNKRVLNGRRSWVGHCVFVGDSEAVPWMSLLLIVEEEKSELEGIWMRFCFETKEESTRSEVVPERKERPMDLGSTWNPNLTLGCTAKT